MESIISCRIGWRKIMDELLVSIIVPCYNVSSTLSKYIDSILRQTYKKIEIIFVDDGSTDSSAEIIYSYKNKIEEQGMRFFYIFQENQGLGAAINTGLKFVNGEFLCWSDPDDFYYEDSIKKRVELLIRNPEYGVVSSDAYVFDENDLKKPKYREAARFENRFEENQFEYLLKEESHFCAGCHMVRMKAFDRVNPKREIYKARRGQNWQLLLPVYYQYKRIYLDEPLYGYVNYAKSMSAKDLTKDAELSRWSEHEEIIINTLKQIHMSDAELQKYMKIVMLRYALKRFYTAIDFRDKKLIREQYIILNKNNAVTKDIRRSYLRNRYLVWKLIFKIKETILRG